MMLTIHGLPTNISYPNLKSIIKTECKITEFILGVLALDDDGTKKVRIGVADDKEGDIVMKCLDGYRLSGHILRVIPMGKSTNTYNDTSYEWRNNQQGTNYDNRAVDPLSNRTSQWPVQGTPQWNANNQPISQVQNQGNFGFAQQGSNMQSSYYQQHEARPQNKMYGQQDNFSQNRGVQQEPFPSTKDRKIPYGNRNTPSTISKPPRGNQSRPHVLTNVEITEHLPTRPQVQGGRYSAQDYNTKGAGIKDHYQGSSQYNAGDQSNQPTQGHYENQGYTSQWSAYKTYAVSKHGESQYEKQSYGNDMMDTNKGMIHSQGKGQNDWNQYDKSHQRDRSLQERRMSPPGHRVSPSGHRILPSGRRISPHRRNSPLVPNTPQTERRISPSARRVSPSARRFSPGRDLPQHGRNIPAGRRMSPSGRMISPSGRQMTQPGRVISPPGRKISPAVRNIAQTGRGIPPAGISPSARRISPSGRRISPSGRRISPSGRRISPRSHRSPPGRKMSPVDRRMLPADRRISPSGRRSQSDHRPSPNVHRISPSGRRISPGHTGDRHMGQRMSPSKPHRDLSTITRSSPSQREYGRSVDLRGLAQRYSSPHTDNMRQIPNKDVRPAYEPTPQAQSQPMYSGGYAQHARENVQFSTTAPRSGDQRPIWQDREKPYNTLKSIDDRSVVARNQKFDQPRELDYQRGINQPEGKLHSPGRMSRSPNRRERSPIRDRYRRHSPSPRSPRRSWALEKRQSPENHETQLPSVWQPKESTYAMQNRPNDERITDPIWEKPYEEKTNPVVPRKEDSRSQDFGDRRYYNSPPRTRWGPKVALPVEQRHPSLPLARQEDRFPAQRAHFSPRDEYSRHVSADCEPRHDRGGHREFMQDRRNENYRQGCDERNPDMRIGADALEIDDVFKRAAELAKKTEEHRKKRSDKSIYSKEPESQRETKTYQHDVSKHDHDNKPVRSNQNPYEASSSYRGSGNSRDLRNVDLSPNIQYKRDKAIDELAGKVMLKYAPDLKGKNRDEVEDRLKPIIESIIFDMFGVKDVSFIEIVIKFEDRHQPKDLERIMHRAMSDAPIENRRPKRSAPDENQVPAKISRDSPSPGMKRDLSLTQANRPLPQREVKRRPSREVSAKLSVPLKRTIQSMRPPPQRTTNVKRSAPVVRSMPVKKIVPRKSVVPVKVPPNTNPTKKELPKTDPPKESSKDLDTKVTPIRTEEKADENKTEFKKEDRKEEDKEKRDDFVLKSRSDKIYELDSSHSHALNLELQRIMIKVWQEFPDKPASAEEKLVADKFRNEAGDSLRNVLGLNVTKRILNFNDGLYVKLYFKSRPDRGHLSQFMRKHNMRTFKCIDSHAHIYAAQMTSFEEFDGICNAGEVLCGRAKVTVRPCYSFTSCPSNLKTIFNGANDSDQGSKEDKKDEGDNKVTSPNKTAEVNKDAKKETDTAKTNKPPAAQIKTEVKSEAAKEKIAPEPTKTAKIVEVTAKEKLELEKVNIGNKTKTQNLTVTDNKKVETKSEPVKKKPLNSPITQSKDIVKKVDKKEIITKKALPKTIKYDKLEIIDEYDAKDTGEIPEKDFGEEDEMDDKDILALMSEGIVLDECGSEEE